MMTPGPEQVIARDHEHTRIRARAANIKPQRRCQLILAVADWPARLTDAGRDADAEWNATVEP